ncbi:hypothetical protein [Inquilinus sp. Marseille-Q2685]|uniref:hypothetical protein n=1 Tax=Inquilinus sp. Marseille-Q2685 TaxID=2866581 RepID=UPI001CE4164A|nr:hypothetical protein [Inquilinus sp. Marseille-Q2685]
MRHPNRRAATIRIAIRDAISMRWGAVLYELATGEPPLKAASTQQWLHAHVAVEAIRPSSIHDAVPELVDEIILKLIAKDPASLPDRRGPSCRPAALPGRLVRRRRDPPFRTGAGRRGGTGTASRHLFGRDAELGLLLEAHARVAASGAAELVLLSGAPG